VISNWPSELVGSYVAEVGDELGKLVISELCPPAVYVGEEIPAGGDGCC